MDIITLAVASFILSLVLTPVVRVTAQRRGWLDQPDNYRKTHDRPIPRIGGIPLLLACAASVSLLAFLGDEELSSVGNTFISNWGLVAAIAIVFFTGLYDDFAGLRPRHKLLCETVAAAFVWAGDVQIRQVAGHSLEGFISLPLTVLWLVACANAFNLIDGVDAVAGGAALVAVLGVLSFAFIEGDALLAIAAAPVAGAILGFLFYNYHPASIFLGDSGSLILGFVLGCFGIAWSASAETLPAAVAPAMLLSVPLLDATLTVARRYLRREPIFAGDRGHIHHRLLNRGFSPRAVALSIVGAATLAAVLALLTAVESETAGWLVLLCFAAAAWVGIRYLEYREFHITANLVVRSKLRTTVRAHCALQDCEQAIRLAASADECWTALQAAAREFGFCQFGLVLAGQSYEEPVECSSEQHWVLHVPISGSEYVSLVCPRESSPAAAMVAPLASLIHRVLPLKSAEFRPQLEDSAAAVDALHRRESDRIRPKAERLEYRPASEPA